MLVAAVSHIAPCFFSSNFPSTPMRGRFIHGRGKSMNLPQLSGPVALRQLLEELATLKSSAYVQVVRRSGPFISMGLVEGSLTHLKCGPTEGNEVLPLLRDVTDGDEIFSWPPRPLAACDSLPEIDEVLRRLGMEATGSQSATKLHDDTRAATGGTRIPKERVFSALCPILRQYVGPMADILCQEAMQSISSFVSESTSLALVDDLAQNLHDAKKAAKFRSTANQDIVSLFG